MVVLKVQSDILRSVDGGELAVLALLDLSATFATVNYGVIFHRLDVSFGFGGRVYSWFGSYFTNRMHLVGFKTSSSNTMTVSFGVSHEYFSSSSSQPMFCGSSKLTAYFHIFRLIKHRSTVSFARIHCSASDQV